MFCHKRRNLIDLNAEDPRIEFVLNDPFLLTSHSVIKLARVKAESRDLLKTFRARVFQLRQRINGRSSACHEFNHLSFDRRRVGLLQHGRTALLVDDDLSIDVDAECSFTVRLSIKCVSCYD